MNKTFKGFLMSLLSRKLIVFLTGTVLLLINKVDQSTWLYIGIGYMGMQAAESTIEKFNTLKGMMTSSESSSTTVTQSSSTSKPEETKPEGEA